MSESKILTSEEVDELEARRPVITVDDEGICVHRVQLSIAERDALCATVRQLLSENERLKELADTRSDLIAAKGAHVDQLQSEVNRLTKERNEALDQCAELHRQIAELKDRDRVCWHCGDVLAVAVKPRCERCPEECDEVNCDAYGCADKLAEQHLDSWK